MIKKVLFSIILVLCVLLISQIATANTIVDDLKTIAKKVMINPGTKIVQSEYGPCGILSTKENISGTSFDYKWDIHKVRVWLSYNDVPVTIEFEHKKYRRAVNSGITWDDAVGCEQFFFIDRGIDGILNEFIKDYYLVVDNYTINLNLIRPKGLMAPDYLNPSNEEKNKLYRDEIRYWLNKELTTEL